MQAKEEAKELVDKFIWNCKHTEYVDDNRYKDSETIRLINSKKCALICVDEIIKEIKTIDFNYDISLEDTVVKYWKEVKEEINRL